FFSSRRRHTRFSRDWSSDVCSSDLIEQVRRGVDGAQCAIYVEFITREWGFKSSRRNDLEYIATLNMFFHLQNKVFEILVAHVGRFCPFLLEGIFREILVLNKKLKTI